MSYKFPKIASQPAPRERSITLLQSDFDREIARARSASQAPPPRQHSQPPAKRAKSSAKPAKKSKTSAPAGPSKPPQVPKKRPQAAILLCGNIANVLKLDQKENERYLREQFVNKTKKWDVTFVTCSVVGANSGQDYNDALNAVKRIKKKMPTLMLVLFPQDNAIDGFMTFAKGVMELLTPASVIGVLGATVVDIMGCTDDEINKWQAAQSVLFQNFMNLKLVNTVHLRRVDKHPKFSPNLLLYDFLFKRASRNPGEYPSDGSGETPKLYMDRLVRRCLPYAMEPSDVMVSTVKPGVLNFGSLVDEQQFDDKSSDEAASK